MHSTISILRAAGTFLKPVQGVGSILNRDVLTRIFAFTLRLFFALVIAVTGRMLASA